MKYLEKIQVLLPLGYLYLILLGLLNESIRYHELGINILHYSSITDILISPISEMFSSPALLIVLLLFVLFFLLIQTILVRNSHTGWGQKMLGNKFNAGISKREMRRAIFPVFVLCVALELLALFVGLGIGGGRKISQEIQHNTYTYNYEVEFTSGKTEKVYLFDLNSSYYFYVTKASKNIHIAPVGTIGNLELIDNPKLEGKSKNKSVRRH